jgi:hypothetical protein
MNPKGRANADLPQRICREMKEVCGQEEWQLHYFDSDDEAAFMLVSDTFKRDRLFSLVNAQHLLKARVPNICVALLEGDKFRTSLL